MFSLCYILAGDTAFMVYYFCPRYRDDILRDFVKAITYGLLVSVAGGKLLFAVTQIPQGRNFWDALLRGGFVFYGGLMGGAVGLAVFCARYRQNFLDWGDIMCSLLPMCQAIGRIGCFCNGCCYGKPYDGFGSVLYPVNGVKIGVYPTWFMESLGCAALFCWLWNRRGRRIRGSVASGYLTGYGILRFCIEFFRGDELRGVWGLLSTSQIISIIMVLAGVGTGIYAWKYKEQNRLW
ncbi:MAG: prolipoprotein diacylglyceryl transferase [Blautia sp.]|nr:prolipoprotein diacylglyceryl transferase [Blautia sp.]